ncbi:MAG: excinuclease ABC subunit UvrC [Acidobacteriia bacterium]|nr:excinuclease ABC subunit UvrC [Terriglobia bacterium]
MILPEEKLNAIPTGPGVYLFLNTDQDIIYVGKARSLRNRVRSYFQASRGRDDKTGRLVEELVDVRTIVVDNEHEALALENNLIKQNRPRFNILLRDDKTYPYLKLTSQEKFPRLIYTRRVRKDGAIYFGPYFPAGIGIRAKKIAHQYLGIRSCSIDIDHGLPRPCLQYHIKRCLGPCVETLCSKDRYDEAVRDARLLLEGRASHLAEQLEARMLAAAQEERFEAAAKFRDLAHTIQELGERQKLATARADDIDIIGIHGEPPRAAVNLFHMRAGRVVERREYFWEDLEEFNPPQFLEAFLKQFYLGESFTPAQIFVPVDFEDRNLLEEILTEKRGRKVEIATPQRGAKREFVELVERNAKLSFDQRFRTLMPSSKTISTALQDALDLEAAPRRIECFDISNIQGTDSVASCVVWEDGKMKKSDYRKFIIKTVEGADDFASMKEVVTRRYRRLRDEKRRLPDLTLVDGGLGQLHAAAEALDSLDLVAHPLAAIAKREEILYLRGRENEPVMLEKSHPVLHLIQQIRDESHRFAVTFHRHRRRQRTLTTELETISGIGPKTARQLLNRFGSVAKVQKASLEELSTVLGPAAAQKVFNHFHSK